MDLITFEPNSISDFLIMAGVFASMYFFRADLWPYLRDQYFGQFLK